MHNFSAKKLNSKFLAKELSAESIVRHFLNRIEKYDGTLGAFLKVFPERALEQAKKLDARRDAGKRLGKLAGVPIALKDNIHVKGEITTCGSKFLTNYRAVFDATVTRLIEEADGIILGKTNMDEFAMGSSTENSALQMSYNPWNRKCVPGGSSGGSSAAVAARLVPISLGSDTGGSVRQPAAFCGTLGFKPSYGRVSRYGLVAFGSSLDQIGPMANFVEDIGLIMEVLGDHDPHDATSYLRHSEEYLMDPPPQGKKIGVPWALLEGIDGEAEESFREAIEALKKLGCEIVDVNLDILKYSIATYYIIATAEASTNLARFDGVRFGVRSSKAQNIEQVYDLSKGEGFGPEVKKRILLGTYVLSSGYKDAYYKQATKVRAKIIEEFSRAFEKVNFIATPSTPNAAFFAGAIQEPLKMYLQDIYTIGVNLAYLPAISIPSGFTKGKLPLSLQLIANKREDTELVRMARAYEKLHPFGEELPPL